MKYYEYCRKSTSDEGRQKLSIQTQHAEIARIQPTWGYLEVVRSIDESRSAKKPGRPLFGEMMHAIEHGKADGIIAWHPDRLSRNPSDAGRIMQLLSTGQLKDLKFVAYTFENTPEGRFMLAIMLGQATYYSEILAVRIVNSIREKVTMGWLPNLPPLGYLNDSETRTIVADPERYPLIQELWRLMVTGNYSVRQLWEMSVKDWGLRTRKHKVLGNKAPTLTAIYRILTSPFYAGIIRWRGEWYPGQHPAMVSLEEFYHVQALLGRPHPKKRNKKEFPFTGLISCGECGFAVTAEDKKNRYGSTYTYYHCTKRRMDADCRQPYVSREALERQVVAFVDSIIAPVDFHDWAMALVSEKARSAADVAEAEHRSIDKCLTAIERERKNLTDLRLREFISDDEYLERRREFDHGRMRLLAKRETIQSNTEWFEPAETLISFSSKATDLIRTGTTQQKRLVLRILSSNPTLHAKMFNADARKPFRFRGDGDPISQLRATVYEVRTLVQSKDADFAEMINQMKAVLTMRPVNGSHPSR